MIILIYLLDSFSICTNVHTKSQDELAVVFLLLKSFICHFYILISCSFHTFFDFNKRHKYESTIYFGIQVVIENLHSNNL